MLKLGFYTLKILVQHNKSHNTKILRRGVILEDFTLTDTEGCNHFDSTTGNYLSIASVWVVTPMLKFVFTSIGTHEYWSSLLTEDDINALRLFSSLCCCGWQRYGWITFWNILPQLSKFSYLYLRQNQKCAMDCSSCKKKYFSPNLKAMFSALVKVRAKYFCIALAVTPQKCRDGALLRFSLLRTS